MRRDWKIGLVGVVLGCATVCLASEVKTDGTWYNFKTVKGTDFGAGVDYAWNHTSFEPHYYNPGPPPWTFTAPSGGAEITVVDGGEIGDVYNVYDSGKLIGTTSTPDPNGSGCGLTPEPCLADRRVSRGVFQLAPGPHSITISVRSTPYPDSFDSWFRVTAGSGQPQPPTPPPPVSSRNPVITSVVAAAGGPGNSQPFIQAGSWISIFGTNLSDETRTWEGKGPRFPASLGGVGVTIDGKPAFLSYASPEQINALVPASRTGTVEVVVRNRGKSSAPFQAEVRRAAPAFFLWSGSSFAVGTRFPDNGLIGDPSNGSTFAGIGRGKIITLWGTGFGPGMSPMVPGEIATAAVIIPAPEVTVGGIRAEVIGAAVSPGLAGVYQIAIRIPWNASIGKLEIRARADGINSPPNVYVQVNRD